MAELGSWAWQVAQILVDAKTDDVVVLDVRAKECSFADEMVVATARSALHCQSAAQAIVYKVRLANTHVGCLLPRELSLSKIRGSSPCLTRKTSSGIVSSTARITTLRGPGAHRGLLARSCMVHEPHIQPRRQLDKCTAAPL